MMQSNFTKADDVFECLKIYGLTVDLRDVPGELRRRYEAVRARGRDATAQQELKKLADEIFIEDILRRAFTGVPRSFGARGFFEAINKRALS